MTAPHWSSADDARQLRGLMAVMLLAAGSLMIDPEAAAEEPVTAVYKAHQVSFVYRSSTLFYPCHELENRVASILITAGARDDVEVKAVDCGQLLTPTDPVLDQSSRWERSNRWGRSTESSRFRRSASDRQQVAHLRIRVLTPVEMTPQVLAEVEKDKARRDLISRVTGNMAAALNDPIVFAAQRQQVTLSHRAPLRLEPEDCELLEQMTSQVFPKVGMRVVRRSSTCHRGELSNIPPQLVVEALLPTGALRPMPEPEKKRDDPAASEAPSGESSEAASETPPQ